MNKESLIATGTAAAAVGAAIIAWRMIITPNLPASLPVKSTL